MRIMIVTDQYIPMVGGVTAVTQGLATELANRGRTEGHVDVLRGLQIG